MNPFHFALALLWALGAYRVYSMYTLPGGDSDDPVKYDEDDPIVYRLFCEIAFILIAAFWPVSIPIVRIIKD